ncbi:MAG: hypothetical protein GTN62_07620 [Gemmatimonadales bacterium]|nr:hypothetical protein [Gemmatimonadales bacterium]NIN11359.1 hypothetical protein [Gemmatimonadales bacterium]NIN49969.1 hypothetical protein [Gemmatimonadales bacterium]NIP07433.1 hypothetical protein [Gemmatimonadales bacterium]NIR00500.1 hypothetical protein [Gemmatimonadales bacterium]
MRRAALLTVVFAVSPLAGLVAQDIPSARPRVDRVRIAPWKVEIVPRKALRPTPNVGLLLAPGSRLNLTEPLARSVRDGARDWRVAGAEALAYLRRSMPRQPWTIHRDLQYNCTFDLPARCGRRATGGAAVELLIWSFIETWQGVGGYR